MWLVGWLVGWFYGVSTLFESFNAELCQFDKSLHVSKPSYLQIYKSTIFFRTQLNVKTVLFQTIQFSISRQFSFISPIHRTLTGSTTSRLSGPWSNGKEVALRIPQSSSITGASPSNCLVSFQDTRGGGGFTPLQRSSLWILQLQLTFGPVSWNNKIH